MANVYDNDEVAPQPKPFPPEMVEDPESKTVGHQVRDYLWGKGPVDYENVSAQMKRELVLKSVEFEPFLHNLILTYRLMIMANGILG